jgi:beta-lactamase class C
MIKIIIFIFSTLSFLIYSKQCPADTIKVKDIQHLINEIEKESKEIIGGAVAIVQNDRVIYKKSFGYREINGYAVDDDTLFGLASVSKAVSSTALAALAQKNLISFDDHISFNGLNLPLKKVLSHTSGYKIRGDSQIEKADTRTKLLSLLKNENEPKFGSNHEYFYSNLIYSLIQDYALSKGYEFNKLITSLDSRFYTFPLDSANLAYPHSRTKEKVSFPSNYQKVVLASGGVFSSLNGMIEFLHIISGNRSNIISKSNLNTLFKSMAKADDVKRWAILPFKFDQLISFYCLGWRKFTLKSNPESTLIFHSGYINGATAFVGTIPKLQLGIVILANQTSSFPLKNGLNLWKAIIKKYKLT